jgi:fatty-acyl-CoA synthase
MNEKELYVKPYPLIFKKVLYSALIRAGKKEIVYRDLKRYTYEEFYNRIRKLASSFQKLGIDHNKTVGIIDWNTHQYLESFYAVQMLGAKLHTINLRLSPEQILWTINYLEDDFFIIRDEFVPLLEKLSNYFKKKPLGYIITGDEIKQIHTSLNPVFYYEELINQGSQDFNFPELEEDLTTLIYFTSGTTGMPKCVYFSQRQQLLQAIMNSIGLTAYPSPVNINSTDVILLLPPLFHGYGWSLPITAMLLGMKIVLPGKYEPKVLLDLIKNEKVTFTAGVVRFLKMILEYPELNKYLDYIKGLKFLQDGEHAPRELFLQCKKYGIKIMEAYGMSEGVGYTFATLKDYMLDWPYEKQLDYINKAGLPLPFCEVKVVDNEGKEVPKDGKTPGEVLVKSAGLTLGYYNDPKRTQESWTSDGWFKTGDVAVIDEEGYILIIDRLKDVVKSGGEWIPTVFLEDLLMRHEAVKEAAVIAAKSEKWSERPLGIVVLKSEYEGRVSEEDLKNHLMKYVSEGKIPKWWIPDKFIFVKEMPLTSVGKIDKKVLRDKYKDVTLP